MTGSRRSTPTPHRTSECSSPFKTTASPDPGIFFLFVEGKVHKVTTMLQLSNVDICSMGILEHDFAVILCHRILHVVH